MLIIPCDQKDDIFKDYSSNSSEKFIIKFSFPILKDIFKMLIKEFKKSEYKQVLLDCNGPEEGYILEKLVYYSLDKKEKVFSEKIEISDSIEINKIFKCTKIFLDPYEYKSIYNEDEKVLNLNTNGIIETLIESNKNYHLFQRNTNGPKFDGALLIPANIKNRKNGDKIFDLTF